MPESLDALAANTEVCAGLPASEPGGASKRVPVQAIGRGGMEVEM